jgi:hypothetical protein
MTQITNAWRSIKRPKAWTRERQAAFMLALRAGNYERLDAMSIRGGLDDSGLTWDGYDYEYQQWVRVVFEPLHASHSAATLHAGAL